MKEQIETPASPYELFHDWLVAGFEILEDPDRYERKFSLPEFATWTRKANEAVAAQLVFPRYVNPFLCVGPVPMKLFFRFNSQEMAVDGGISVRGMSRAMVPGAFDGTDGAYITIALKRSDSNCLNQKS